MSIHMLSEQNWDAAWDVAAGPTPAAGAGVGGRAGHFPAGQQGVSKYRICTCDIDTRHQNWLHCILSWRFILVHPCSGPLISIGMPGLGRPPGHALRDFGHALRGFGRASPAVRSAGPGMTCRDVAPCLAGGVRYCEMWPTAECHMPLASQGGMQPGLQAPELLRESPVAPTSLNKGS